MTTNDNDGRDVDTSPADDGAGDITNESDAAEVSTCDSPRRGDVEKCPACGSRVDAEAYHCPTCQCSFCFHCRARLLRPEVQLQCVHQGCDYYGKLVCALCDPPREKEEPPSVYAEPEDGYWPAWLLLILVVAGITWYYTSFLAALVTAILVYAGGGYLLHRLGLNLFGKVRTVEHQRKTNFHECLRCRRPAKQVAGTE